MPKLNANTIVTNPANFAPEVLYAGNEVPDWATDLVGHHLVVADEISSGEPPRTGKGSGKDAWRDHATSLGLDLADDATREDIIAAVDALSAARAE